jgi:phosphohistidine phosphatase SixA
MGHCELPARINRLPSRGAARGAVWARDRLVQREGLGPKDQVAATKEALEQTGGDLMIVGHLPFLGKLVALLVTGSEKMKSWSLDLAA